MKKLWKSLQMLEILFSFSCLYKASGPPSQVTLRSPRQPLKWWSKLIFRHILIRFMDIVSRADKRRSLGASLGWHACARIITRSPSSWERWAPSVSAKPSLVASAKGAVSSQALGHYLLEGSLMHCTSFMTPLIIFGFAVRSLLLYYFVTSFPSFLKVPSPLQHFYLVESTMVYHCW